MNEEDRKMVTERLEALNGRIQEFRQKLEHHGLYDENHKMTEENLKQRMNQIEQEVASRMGSGGQTKDAITWLEHEIEKWVVSTDVDYKS